MSSQTTQKVDSADFEPWVHGTCQYAFEDPLDIIEEAESAAPKFSVHTIKAHYYVAIIDPTWIKKFDSKFNAETIHQITGVEQPKLLEGIVLYFRSPFSLESIKQAISFSFL